MVYVKKRWAYPITYAYFLHKQDIILYLSFWLVQPKGGQQNLLQTNPWNSKIKLDY